MLYESISLHCQHKHAVQWLPVGAETDWGLKEAMKKKKKLGEKRKTERKEARLHLCKY